MQTDTSKHYFVEVGYTPAKQLPHATCQILLAEQPAIKYRLCRKKPAEIAQGKRGIKKMVN
ncbi:hypothetical protein FACS189472_17460 [Alphaproteobacteria bacterium]|nr:hypothetical protein FACS189472_17460 [Alphaproteobacteria bacterium]